MWRIWLLALALGVASCANTGQPAALTPEQAEPTCRAAAEVTANIADMRLRGAPEATLHASVDASFEQGRLSPETASFLHHLIVGVYSLAIDDLPAAGSFVFQDCMKELTSVEA